MHPIIEELKRKITSMDTILQGTVLKQYKACGKKNCRCGRDTQYWHGPYWVWTRKEKGKTITKTLKDRNQVKMIQKAFKNMQQINQILGKWKGLSLKVLEDNNKLRN